VEFWYCHFVIIPIDIITFIFFLLSEHCSVMLVFSLAREMKKCTYHITIQLE